MKELLSEAAKRATRYLAQAGNRQWRPSWRKSFNLGSWICCICQKAAAPVALATRRPERVARYLSELYLKCTKQHEENTDA
jgi:hypothetical protein